MSPMSLTLAAGLRLLRLCRAIISWREVFRAEMLFTSDMPTHTKKNGALRVLVPIKRANISAFGLYDRAAGPLAVQPRAKLSGGSC